MGVVCPTTLMLVRELLKFVVSCFCLCRKHLPFFVRDADMGMYQPAFSAGVRGFTMMMMI
jgi:hypothetical protein